MGGAGRTSKGDHTTDWLAGSIVAGTEGGDTGNLEL